MRVADGAHDQLVGHFDRQRQALEETRTGRHHPITHQITVPYRGYAMPIVPDLLGNQARIQGAIGLGAY